MASDEPSTAQCVECHEQIKRDAKKCIKCGSYQDWRRFLAPYQTLIAIGLSIFAIIAALANGGRDSIAAVSKLFEEDTTELSAFITAISPGGIEIFARNDSDSSLNIIGLSCVIYLPKSDAELARHFLERRAQNLDTAAADGELFTGPYFLNYQLMNHILLHPGFGVTAIGFLDASQMSNNEPPETLGKDMFGCFLSGKNEKMDTIGAVMALDLQSLKNFGAKGILNLSEFIGFSDDEVIEIFDAHSEQR